jgi:predicted NAD-dependent protein-ADP-ribosyltransferase YbiA (DUF1768 family)
VQSAFEVDGERYVTVEHFYQSIKFKLEVEFTEDGEVKDQLQKPQ